ncbi:Hsp20/alpha crystallin family protein [Candidatus Nitrospira bockiana]
MAMLPVMTDVDRLIHEALAGTTPIACNVWEDQERFVIEVAVPGWDPKALDATIANGMLTIRGTASDSSDAGRTYLVHEHGLASFERSFILPEFVDPSKVVASCKDGLLRIEVSKREDAKPRRILIDAAAAERVG